MRSTCRQISPCAEGRLAEAERYLDLKRIRWKSGSISQKHHVPVCPCWWQTPAPPMRSPNLFVVPRDACSAPACICGSSHLSLKKAGHNPSCLAHSKVDWSGVPHSGHSWPQECTFKQKELFWEVVVNSSCIAECMFEPLACFNKKG